MKLKFKFNKKDTRVVVITLIAGLFSGWLLFHGQGNENVNRKTTEQQHEHEKATVWTCSMHPQIRMDKPGKCPICAMDLIPLEETKGADDSASFDEIKMSDEAMKLAEVQTMIVSRAEAVKELFLLGKVKPDERNIAELTARFGGRIEKLYVNFTGESVEKGEKLASIYSPSLVTAQKELLEAVEYKNSNPEFYAAARSKLKLWDLTDAQIAGIEQKGDIQHYFDVLSPISGTVTQRYISSGDYVKEGNPLFQVIDLEKVWVMFEAYEADLPWVRLGDKVNFTVKSLPGRSFSGRVTFIDPVINPSTRVTMVRVELANPGLQLKPDMFANGIIKARTAGNKKELFVPKTAILWTGKRAVVYVKIPGRDAPSFLRREITLGPEAEDSYIVADGIDEGEEIAVNGVFKIDAAAQLAGKPSMMNPKGGESSMGHDMSKMDTKKGEHDHK